MDIEATLKEIATLSIDDRIQIVQAIWNEIEADSTGATLLTQVQKQEIDRRLHEYEQNPDDTLTWAEIDASITTIEHFTDFSIDRACFAESIVTNLERQFCECQPNPDGIP